jgi:hypothetical protein
MKPFDNPQEREPWFEGYGRFPLIVWPLLLFALVLMVIVGGVRISRERPAPEPFIETVTATVTAAEGRRLTVRTDGGIGRLLTLCEPMQQVVEPGSRIILRTRLKGGCRELVSITPAE